MWLYMTIKFYQVAEDWFFSTWNSEGFVIPAIRITPEDIVFVIAVAIAAASMTLLAYRLWVMWVKKKGYRMVLRDRNDKAHALLSQVISDGLFEAQCRGELSRQEINALYKELSRKLDLPDLVPKKHRLEIVKAELKKNRNSTNPEIVAARRHRPNIPGGLPMPAKKAPFSEKLGKLANKIWK